MSTTNTTDNKTTTDLAKKDSFLGFVEQAVGPFISALPAETKDSKLVSYKAAYAYSVKKNPTLLKCDKASFFLAIQASAQYDLMPGEKQECALVPFGSQVVFIPMVRGLIKILYRAGIKSVDTEVIYKNDFFEYEQGTNIRLSFKKNILGDRGEKVGAYCVVKYRDFDRAEDSIVVEVMSIKELDAIRRKAKNSSIWNEHQDEMYRKTVLKRAVKRCSLDPQVQEIINKDNQLERPDYSAQLDELNEKLESVQPTGLLTADEIEQEQINNEEK